MISPKAGCSQKKVEWRAPARARREWSVPCRFSRMVGAVVWSAYALRFSRVVT
jgi:hypothetical protein